MVHAHCSIQLSIDILGYHFKLKLSYTCSEPIRIYRLDRMIDNGGKNYVTYSHSTSR